MEVNIAGTLAPVLGVLQGQMEVSVQKAIEEIKHRLVEILEKQIEIQKKGILAKYGVGNIAGNLLNTPPVTAGCAELSKIGDKILLSMEDLKRKRDGTISFLEKANKRVKAIQDTLVPLQKVLKVSKVVITILKLLPIPQGFPPGIGLPMNLTILASDLLNFLQKLIDMILKAITALTIILNQVLRILQQLIAVLKSLDFIFKLLSDAIKLLKGLCSKKVDPGELSSSGLLTEEGLLGLTPLTEELINGLRTGPPPGSSPDLLTGVDMTGNLGEVKINDRGVWKPQEDYVGTKKEKDLVERLGKMYLCMISHHSTEEGERGGPENGYKYWKFVGKKSEKPQPIGDSVADLLTGIVKTRTEGKGDEETKKKVNDFYKQLLNSNIPQDVKDSLEFQEDPPENEKIEDQTKEREYVSRNGVRYRLQIFRDETYSYLAPRHYVNAYTLDGILRITGTPSFSSSTRVLYDEIIYQIETQF